MGNAAGEKRACDLPAVTTSGEVVLLACGLLRGLFKGGQMRLGGVVLGLSLAASTFGCAERTTLMSHPSGAKFYVNDQFVGSAPIVLSVPRGKFHGAFQYRAELDGYQTERGPIPTQVHRGRVTGALFTLGVAALFKPPTGFVDPIEVTLRPDPASFGGMPSKSVPAKLSVEERLQGARELRQAGTITEQEYKQRKQEILREF